MSSFKSNQFSDKCITPRRRGVPIRAQRCVAVNAINSPVYEDAYHLIPVVNIEPNITFNLYRITLHQLYPHLRVI